jgi:hypothetical protein
MFRVTHDVRSVMQNPVSGVDMSPKRLVHYMGPTK